MESVSSSSSLLSGRAASSKSTRWCAAQQTTRQDQKSRAKDSTFGELRPHGSSVVRHSRMMFAWEREVSVRATIKNRPICTMQNCKGNHKQSKKTLLKVFDRFFRWNMAFRSLYCHFLGCYKAQSMVPTCHNSLSMHPRFAAAHLKTARSPVFIFRDVYELFWWLKPTGIKTDTFL